MSQGHGGHALRVAVITISDKSSRGEREDLSGPAVVQSLAQAGIHATVVSSEIVPDEQPTIAARLSALADGGTVDLVLTTGGTGLAPRDVTPQATRSVIDFEVPGIAEVMRAESMRVTPGGMLSRAVAGVRSRVLIVNLPGSPKAVRETIAIIAPALPHAVETLRGSVGDHIRPS